MAHRRPNRKVGALRAPLSFDRPAPGASDGYLSYRASTLYRPRVWYKAVDVSRARVTRTLRNGPKGVLYGSTVMSYETYVLCGER